MGKTSWYEPAQVSQAMQEKIDDEVGKLIDTGYKQALVIVKREKKIMDKVVEQLLKHETLGRDEFEKIVGKK